MIINTFPSLKESEDGGCQTDSCQTDSESTTLHVDCNLFVTRFLLSCSIITLLFCLPQITMTLYMTLSTFDGF